MNAKLKMRILEKYGSQIRFARAIEEDDTLVSKVVRGWRELDDDRQIRWAQALGTTPRELFKEAA